jgi:Protein of unknown function (DUF3500)
MAERAKTWWQSLDPEQRHRALSSFDSPDAHEFTYLPGERPGLALTDMDTRQQLLAMKVLESGLSSTGADTARSIMQLEATLREIERGAGDSAWEGRDPSFYWFRLLGLPDDFRPWGFTVGGHHVCLHFTISEFHVAGTPQFFGANPAIVPSGPQAGLQTLRQEEDLARELLGALDKSQLEGAIVSPEAPSDIKTRRDPVADIGLVPRGLRYEDLDLSQKRQLERLVRHYLGRLRHDLASTAWRALVDEGLSEVSFAWLGSTTRREPHYYAVTGQSFLLEYDCVQDGANHVHTVWRDVRSDWGMDVLARHHAAGRH